MSDLPYVYAAILDVLGYRERLKRDQRQGTLEFKSLLESALSCLTAINDAEFSYQAISDTVILTCSDRQKLIPFLRVLRDLQIGFLQSGLHLRGGVAFQRHFRSGTITYSAAYAAAYELESKLAIYPRIVIDHNIVEMFELNDDVSGLSNSELLCECNGVFFLNILSEANWVDVYNQAKRIYETDANDIRRVEAVFAKHLWFQEYLFSSPFADASLPRYMPAISVWKDADTQDSSHDARRGKSRESF